MNNTQSNVTRMADRAPQAQCRFSINCVLRGFPIVIEGEGRAGDLRVIVDRLLSIGAEPPAAQAVQPAKQNGAPTCPVHNIPMAPSKQRAGTYYCKSVTGQAEDGRTLYCTKKA